MNAKTRELFELVKRRDTTGDMVRDTLKLHRQSGDAAVQLNTLDEDGFAMLHYCALSLDESSRIRAAGIAEALIEAGADIDVRNIMAETPLLVACCYCNAPVIELLLAHGANARAIDRTGHSCLVRLRGAAAAVTTAANREHCIALIEQTLQSPREAQLAALTEATVDRGTALFHAGDIAGAHREYSKAIALREDCWRAFANRCQCNMVLHDFDQALSDAVACVGLQPANAKSWWRLAKAHMGLHDLTRALKALKEGLRWCPGNQDLAQLAAELESRGAKADRPAAPEEAASIATAGRAGANLCSL